MSAQLEPKIRKKSNKTSERNIKYFESFNMGKITFSPHQLVYYMSEFSAKTCSRY